MCRKQHWDEPPAPQRCGARPTGHLLGLPAFPLPSLINSAQLTARKRAQLFRASWPRIAIGYAKPFGQRRLQLLPTRLALQTVLPAPQMPVPAGHKPTAALQPLRIALFHRKRIKVASPAPPACGYLVSLLRNSMRARTCSVSTNVCYLYSTL